MRTAAALLLLLAAQDGAGDGRKAFREGRFEDAWRAFAASEAEAGDEASAELSYNLALAALAAGRMPEAEAAAERAAARGGPAFDARRAFIRGSAAFARCLKAEIALFAPAPPPAAFTAAIAQAEAARDAWQEAAAGRADWPEARRNVERARIKLAALRKMKEDAERDKKRKDPTPEERPQPEPEPRPEPPRKPETVDEPAPVTEADELPPAEVRRLAEKLAKKEAEKTRLRLARVATGTPGVERDW